MHNVCNYKRGQNSYFIHESLPIDLKDEDLQTKLLTISLKLEPAKNSYSCEKRVCPSKAD